jgi:hypothetical protein
VSDGGAHTKFLTAGRYPTETLATEVRDNHWITYEEAHRRLASLPTGRSPAHLSPAWRLDGYRRSLEPRQVSTSPPWPSRTVPGNTLSR